MTVNRVRTLGDAIDKVARLTQRSGSTFREEAKVWVNEAVRFLAVLLRPREVMARGRVTIKTYANGGNFAEVGDLGGVEFDGMFQAGAGTSFSQSGVLEVEKVWLLDSDNEADPLEWTSMGGLMDEGVDLNETGRPNRWMVMTDPMVNTGQTGSGQWIKLWPTPDSTYFDGNHKVDYMFLQELEDLDTESSTVASEEQQILQDHFWLITEMVAVQMNKEYFETHRNDQLEGLKELLNRTEQMQTRSMLPEDMSLRLNRRKKRLRNHEFGWVLTQD